MARHLSHIALSVSLLFVGGCAVGPDYVCPELASPPSFMGSKDVADRKVVAEQPGTTSEAWWDRFDDPLLSRLIGQALSQNLDIAQAVARVSQARAGLQTATAALLPSGTVAGSATAAHFSEQSFASGPVGTPGVGRNAEQYEAYLNAGWEIDLFGGLRRDREASLARYIASSADADATRLSIAAQVADTYIVVRALQLRIAVVEGQVETQRKLVDTITLQYRKGIAAELQVRQSEGILAQVEAGLPELQAGLDAAMNSLDVLLGQQPGTNRAALAAPSAIPAPPAIVEIGSPGDLLRRRPDLVVAENQLHAANAQIGSAISEYFPKFSVGGFLGSATTSAGNLLEGPANTAQGILGLRWRLFDFGRVDAEIKAARGRNAEALAAYRASVLRASEDVENAFSSLLNSESQTRTLMRGEVALARAQQVATAAYHGGVVSLIEVLDADTRLLQTRDRLAQSRAQSARAAVASFRALGGGWESPLEPGSPGLSKSVPSKSP